jgi:hypothetical protein
MDWKKERDLLIAQTLAFVQSVTGKTPEFEQSSVGQATLDLPSPERTSPEPIAVEQMASTPTSLTPARSAPTSDVAIPDQAIRAIRVAWSEAPEAKPASPANELPAAAVPKVPLSLQIPRSILSGDVRTEMQARVANFRAHQERFHREREAYFSATLKDVRSTVGNPGPDSVIPRQTIADPGSRSSAAPAAGVSKTPGDSRSSESGPGPS